MNQEQARNAPHLRCYRPSEANMIIDRFRALATDQKHVNLDFLRAL